MKLIGKRIIALEAKTSAGADHPRQIVVKFMQPGENGGPPVCTGTRVFELGGVAYR
jgi:hypothetical protein